MNKTINGLKKLISARRAHIVSSQPKAAFEKMPDLSIEKDITVPPMPEVEVSTAQADVVEVPAELSVTVEAATEEAPVTEVAEVVEAPAEEEAPAKKSSYKSKKKKKS